MAASTVGYVREQAQVWSGKPRTTERRAAGEGYTEGKDELSMGKDVPPFIAFLWSPLIR